MIMYVRPHRSEILKVMYSVSSGLKQCGIENKDDSLRPQQFADGSPLFYWLLLPLSNLSVYLASKISVTVSALDVVPRS